MSMCFSIRSPFSAFSVLESRSPMIRSESRTEETSGLVTITAASANRIARVAPRSIPAGLSQMTQSNLLRISFMTAATPTSVRASLSRVCEAGSSHNVSKRLSRIRACESFATPWITLMRSKTTRRSAPNTRSRLRSPTSKSTTATFCPAWARAAPSAAVEVVLPTPPLPDVTTRTFGILLSPPPLSVQGCYRDDAIFEPALGWAAAKTCVYLLGSAVVPVDRDELGFVPGAEDSRARVAGRACHRSSAQRAVDMDGAPGNDLGAGGDRAEHGHVAVRENDRLAGADRALNQQRARLTAPARNDGSVRGDRLAGCACAASLHERRQQ